MKKLLLIVLVALTLAPVASASTKLDATKVAWYLKGEGDAVLPDYGVHADRLKCQPTTTRDVRCTIRLVPLKTGIASTQCGEGKFHIEGFTVVGQWSKPHNCKSPPGA